MKKYYFTIIIILFITSYSIGLASEYTESVDSTQIALVLSYEITPQKKSSSGLKNAAIDKFKLTVNLPQTIEGRQEITKIAYEPQPSRTFMENSNKYAEYDLSIPREKTIIKIRIEAVAFRYDLTTAVKKQNQGSLSQTELRTFLMHERMIEKDDPAIQKIARTIEDQTELDIVKKIYKYEIRNITPDVSKSKGIGAVETAKTKRGKCIDYCDLFVALCRAKNIPARVAAGYKANFSVTPKHSWVEVYFNEYGWVPFDVSMRSDTPDQLLDKRFHNLPAQYLYFTNLRNDHVLHNNYYFCYPTWDMNLRKVINPIVEKIKFEKPVQKKHDSLKLEQAGKTLPNK